MKLSFSEIKELREELDFIGIEDWKSFLDNFSHTDDQFIKTCDGEFRVIADSIIWEIYVEEIKQIVEDCYDLNLDKIPSWIAWSIDWEKTAQNTYPDGYGHTFALYDGREDEIQIDNVNYWIFRTN